MSRTNRQAAVSISGIGKTMVIGAAALAGLHAQPALANPTGATVVRGNVTITQDGNRMIIRASNGSIINYLNFNIGAGEVVRFIQPGDWARVLNRVTSNDPTQILGTLRSNGQIYLVNPAGIMFGQGAVVNVGGIYAAAGNITNANFINGLNKFTGLDGSVVNHGSITADSTISLLGEHVKNSGNIRVDQGVITMVAGNDVTLIPNGSRITVKVDGQRITDRANPLGGSTGPELISTPGVENTGTITANRGQIVLGAGDLYSLAIRNSGTISAPQGSITLGATDGLVHNTATGVISADAVVGQGGEVTVQGPSVLNEGRLSANSADGEAGSVELTSQNHTYMTDTSRISAAGTSGNADGGNVLVHSYNGTTIMARGARIDISGGLLGGDGGFAEVSGHYLSFSGYVNMKAKQGYELGQLLLDPLHIIIQNGGADTGPLSGGIITFDEPNATDSLFIDPDALEALVGTITLQALGTIWVNDQVDLVNNNNLIFQAYDDITLAAAINGANNIDFHADYDNNGVGRVNLGVPMSISGDAVLRGAVICLNGYDFSADGSIDFMSPVQLCVDSVVSGTNVRFHDTINDTNAGQESLTVNADLARFDGEVGGDLRLEYLRVNGPSEINGGLVVTEGFQKYFGDVHLGDDTVMQSTAAGQILFNNRLDGPHNLDVLTAGQTRFNGNVGEYEALASLHTDGPGKTFINANLVNGQIIDINDVAALGKDVDINGTTSVDFAQTLDGNGHDLIVNSPRTGFHGDVTEMDLLRTDAAGRTDIGADITGNKLDFLDDVRLLSASTTTGRDFVNFGQTLNGPWDLVVYSDGYVRFGGDVGGSTPLATLTTHIAPPGVVDHNLVLIDGHLIRVDGDILFNPEGRDRPAEVATVACRSTGIEGVVIESKNGKIFMGENEKLTAMSNLSLLATNGSLTLGDINVFGNLTTNTPHADLYAREGGFILDRHGNLVADERASYVVWGTYKNLNPNMTVSLLGNGKTPVFASRVSDQITGPFGAFLKALFAALQKADFTYGGTILDLSPPIRNPSNLAEAFAGPVPFHDRVYRDPFVIRDAGNLGINMRPAQFAELLETTIGVQRYMDADPRPDMLADQREMSTFRLRRSAVLGALDEYNKVYLADGGVDADGNSLPPVDNKAHVREVLASSWQAYAAQVVEGEEPSADGYRAWLEANKDVQAEALAYVTSLRELIVNVKSIGLSPAEQVASLNKVTQPVNGALPTPHYEQVLGL